MKRAFIALALCATSFVLAAPTASAASTTVVINEVNCEGTDWVELANTSAAPIDLSGWLLTDDALDRNPPRSDHRYVFPAGTTLGAAEKLVVEKSAQGFAFGISCGDDTIRLADSTGALVDDFVVPASGGGPPPDASWVFDPSAVPVIDLTLPQATIDALNADPTSEYHDASFTLRRASGQTYGPLAVGVRLKGSQGSFRGLDKKAAFKLKFNHTVGAQRFQGLKKMTLNNMVQDPSMLRETLSYKAFREMGVPAPRTGYAFVRVNGADYGVYLNVETLDDVALGRLVSTTQHLYEGGYGIDVLPGSAPSFEVDEGSEADRSDLDALIAAVGATDGWFDTVNARADLSQMTAMWALERYLGHWDGYVGLPGAELLPNNFYLHSDSAGRFRMLPWGTDQSLFYKTTFDTGDGVLFTKCLATPTCAALYRTAVANAATTVPTLHLDELAVATAQLLAPWQARDPRREGTLAAIDDKVAVARAFLAGRPAEALDWLDIPVVIGVPKTAPNAAGWYKAKVTIDWRATDRSSVMKNPRSTSAATQGAEVLYRSAQACDASGNCATGTFRVSLDSAKPTLAPVLPSSILLRAPVTVDARAADALSGVSSQTCGAPDTNRVGPGTVSCVVTDRAGNSASASLKYLVQYRLPGFALTELRSGQTATIKVPVRDASGASIGGPESSSLASNCRVKVAVKGMQSGGGCMKYDAAEDVFVYQLKVGKKVGPATLTATVGYTGTTQKTSISTPVTITG